MFLRRSFLLLRTSSTSSGLSLKIPSSCTVLIGSCICWESMLCSDSARVDFNSKASPSCIVNIWHDSLHLYNRYQYQMYQNSILQGNGEDHRNISHITSVNVFHYILWVMGQHFELPAKEWLCCSTRSSVTFSRALQSLHTVGTRMIPGRDWENHWDFWAIKIDTSYSCWLHAN